MKIDAYRYLSIMVIIALAALAVHLVLVVPPAEGPTPGGAPEPPKI